MNTSEVAKSLGVSSSTIQRWVKQLELPMEKNDRGHYHFTSEDIDQLKTIHEQLQNGTLLQEIAPVKARKSFRKGIVTAVEKDEVLEKIMQKVNNLEVSLNTKADSVASYQLLQHRQEIEDLKNQVKHLTKQLGDLDEKFNEMKKKAQIDQPHVLNTGKIKRKKKNIVSSLFGF
ncbi:chromosome-anchoring protein RacA [Bacillus sp. SLBN-46]|uniref:MerR family transcriptional regulator n=1 Tax=Bacillus sp. SLBN-46 TaxID=3042283 RepID=UPI00285BDB53|nr:MerR family transcriptional regulator [Bacillus sp. SLBN-46]MDR6122869.1 chromosome-anchoring protein RacA [Bacillus sp. SLBN-46]